MSSLMMLLISLIILLVTIQSVFSYEIILEDSFEVLIFDSVCPSLNLSLENCTVFYDALVSNETIIYNNTFLIDNSSFYYNQTIINNTIYVNDTRTIVVNQTLIKIIDNTTQALLDHEYRMAKLNHSTPEVDLSQYMTSAQINLLIADVRDYCDSLQSITAQSTASDSGFSLDPVLVAFVVIGFVLVLFFLKDKIKGFGKKIVPDTLSTIPKTRHVMPITQPVKHQPKSQSMPEVTDVLPGESSKLF